MAKTVRVRAEVCVQESSVETSFVTLHTWTYLIFISLLTAAWQFIEDFPFLEASIGLITYLQYKSVVASY